MKGGIPLILNSSKSTQIKSDFFILGRTETSECSFLMKVFDNLWEEFDVLVSIEKEKDQQLNSSTYAWKLTHVKKIYSSYIFMLNVTNPNC